jgi:YD repeat-containing protein
MIELLIVVAFFVLLLFILGAIRGQGVRRPKGLTARKCVYCRSWIEAKATVCPHCTRDVEATRWIWDHKPIKRPFWLFIGAILFGALIYSAMPARAQQTTFRNERGQTTGTAATTGNMTTYRDGQGRTVGTGTTNGGTTIYRDSSGRTTGTATAPRRRP